MKYFYLSILLAFAIDASAQLSIINLADNSPINDGDIFLFDQLATSPNPNDSQGKLKFKIFNTSATESINVQGQVVSFSNTDGTGSQFCIQPSCFFDMSAGQFIPNNPLTLAPGADNNDFDSFYNSNPGDGVNYPLTYTIRFFMLDDNGQEVGDDIAITYSYTPANFSNSNFTLEDLGIVLHSTVVSEFIDFTFKSSVEYRLYDLNGRLLETKKVNAGNYSHNVSDLNAGHYILAFGDKTGKQSKTRFFKK